MTRPGIGPSSIEPGQASAADIYTVASALLTKHPGRKSFLAWCDGSAEHGLAGRSGRRADIEGSEPGPGHVATPDCVVFGFRLGCRTCANRRHFMEIQCSRLRSSIDSTSRPDHLDAMTGWFTHICHARQIQDDPDPRSTGPVPQLPIWIGCSMFLSQGQVS